MSTAARALQASPSTRRHPFFWIVVAAGAVAFTLMVVVTILLLRYGNLYKDWEWECVAEGDAWYVSKVDPQGVAAGKLQVGDRILSVEDFTPRPPNGPHFKIKFLPANASYTVSVLRGSEAHEFDLSLPPLKSRPIGWSLLFPLVPSLVALAIALLVGILKPEQRLAQLCFIAFIIEIFFHLRVVLGEMLPVLPEYGLVLFYLTGFALAVRGPIAYHFFYRFPPGVPKARIWSILLVWFYIGTFFLQAYFLHRNLFSASIFPFRTDWVAHSFLFDWQFARAAFLFGDMHFLVVRFCIAAVLVRNYIKVKEPDQRRRIKWLTCALVIGMLPLVLTYLMSFVSRVSGVTSIVRGTPFAILIASQTPGLMLIYTGIAYTILKHRMFDINIVVRRGLKYLLAKNVLQVILVLPLVGLAYAVISNRHQSFAEIVTNNPVYLALIAAAGLSLKFRKQLKQSIDRRFFREAYNQERILIELIDQIKELDSMAEICRLVSQQLDAALHPKGTYIFYREAERRDLTLGYSSGGTSQAVRIPESSQLLHTMERFTSVQAYPLPRHTGLPQDEEEWLNRLGINLIVPMTGTDQRLSGLLLFGEKQSEEPYSATDRRLLQAVASEMAIVHENMTLKARVDKEQKLQRDVLARLEDRQINLVKECPVCGSYFDSSAQVCEQDHSELSLSLPVERTIEGKYRLERLLGKGGMGVVCEATDLRLARRVAVKIMFGSAFSDGTAMRRFEREARTSARLNHPNIVAVYDFGRLGPEGAFLVMELVQGVTLRAEIDRARALAPPRAAEWFDQLCEGLKAAHEGGVIHRDLKPENLIIAKNDQGRPVVKVLDFGLAKVSRHDLPDPNTLTVKGAVLGTLSYMSPEQLMGEEADERSDIFAVGVMGVEALTGQRPFRGKTHTELLKSILHDSFQLGGEAKEAGRLNRVLQECLAKDRKDRFASVAEMQERLVPAIRNCPPLKQSEAADIETDTMIQS